MNISIGCPSLAFDGELTFVGALRQFINEYDEAGNRCGISRRWNSNTLATYIRHYERILIPIIEELYGAEKPLHSFTESEFEQILAKVSQRYHYSRITLQHYRYLLWVVYLAGVNHDLYPDRIFWGGVLDYDSNNPEEVEKQKIILSRIPKSFTLSEEFEMARWISSLSAESITGEELGLLIMYFSALRENEVAGLDFRNIYIMREGTKEIPVIEMVKSTRIDSSKRKSGGKTPNAPRLIPIPWGLYQFIAKRRLFLEGLIEKEELVLPDGKTIDNLSLACVGSAFLKGTNTNNISKRGHKLLAEIGVSKKKIIAIQVLLRDKERVEQQLIEEDPTTYLFRRSGCSTYSMLGFTEEQIEYLMGHEIENQYIFRNFFLDFGTLYEIWQRIEQNPIKVFLDYHQSKKEQEEEKQEFRWSSEESIREIELICQNEEKLFELQIQAIEPSQPVSLEIIRDGGEKFNAAIYVTTPPIEYQRTVEACEELIQIYQKYLDQVEGLSKK